MRKRNLKKIIIFVSILCISIGFAVLTATLSMNASFSFAQNSFNLYFSNINVSNISTVTSPTATITDDTTISYSGTFNKPGDYIEFSFYIINNGTIDGQINTISTGLTTEQSQYIDYSLKYAIDNSNVNSNDIIYAGQARKVKAHFEYKEDIDDFIDLSSLNVNLTMHFIQPQIVSATVWNYEYLGDEQFFVVPKNGKYKLEVWGAQGGEANYSFIGGYGGYSVGSIQLQKNSKLFINDGGKGVSANIESTYTKNEGGYNGGGNGYQMLEDVRSAGGVGATHIALSSGLLYQFSSNVSNIIIVAGGGSGAYSHFVNHFNPEVGSNGSAGGGYKGVGINNNQGTQSSGAVFGYAAQAGLGVGEFTTTANYSGGGGGYYGGVSRPDGSAGGGSGFIGNDNLTDKIMYCYGCPTSENESDESNIKTRPTSNFSSTATSQYAKVGNGYVRITLLN